MSLESNHSDIAFWHQSKNKKASRRRVFSSKIHRGQKSNKELWEADYRRLCRRKTWSIKDKASASSQAPMKPKREEYWWKSVLIRTRLVVLITDTFSQFNAGWVVWARPNSIQYSDKLRRDRIRAKVGESEVRTGRLLRSPFTEDKFTWYHQDNFNVKNCFPQLLISLSRFSED